MVEAQAWVVASAGSQHSWPAGRRVGSTTVLWAGSARDRTGYRTAGAAWVVAGTWPVVLSQPKSTRSPRLFGRSDGLGQVEPDFCLAWPAEFDTCVGLPHAAH